MQWSRDISRFFGLSNGTPKQALEKKSLGIGIAYSDDDDGDHQSDDGRPLIPRVPSSTRTKKSWSWMTVILLTVINSAILALNLMMFNGPPNIRNPELRKTSTWSPLYDLIDLELHTVTVNGTVWPSESPSITSQHPNPDADAIWDEWGQNRVFPITKNELEKLGGNTTTAVKLDDSVFGLGHDMYAAQLDVYHHLHCLDTLRRIVYGSYYNETQANPDPHQATIHEYHINHCVDMLAQVIQCSGNLNLLTVYWAKNMIQPQTEFSIERKCVNFEKLTEWRYYNTIDGRLYMDFIKTRPDPATMAPDPRPDWVLNPI